RACVRPGLLYWPFLPGQPAGADGRECMNIQKSSVSRHSYFSTKRRAQLAPAHKPRRTDDGAGPQRLRRPIPCHSGLARTVRPELATVTCGETTTKRAMRTLSPRIHTLPCLGGT